MGGVGLVLLCIVSKQKSKKRAGRIILIQRERGNTEAVAICPVQSMCLGLVIDLKVMFETESDG